MIDDLNLDGLVEPPPLDVSGLVQPPKPITSHLPELLGFIKEKGLTPGSTTNGKHNIGSKHYSGNAVDLKGSGSFSNDQVLALKRDAASRGFLVRDERTRPPNQKVWGGPHVHIEYVGGNPASSVSDNLNLDGLVEPLNVEGLTESVVPPVPMQLSTNDTEWHFGENMSNPSPRAMRVLQEAVAEDERKKRLYGHVDPPDIVYQNKMRVKAGLKPLQVGPTLRAAQAGQEAPRPLGNNPLMPTVDRAQAFAEDEARKEAEAKYAEQTAGGLRGLAQMAGLPTQLLPTSAQDWINSALAQGAGDLTNLTAGLVRNLPGDPFDNGTKRAANKIENVGNEISSAAQIMDRHAARGRLSQGAKDLLGGTIGSSPVYALMALGVPPPVAFGLHAYLMERGHDADLLDTLTETSKAATIGALFDLPLPAKQGILNEVGRRLAKAGVVGGGTAALSALQGRGVQSDALVNALFAGAGGAKTEGIPDVPGAELRSKTGTMPEIPDVPVSSISEPRVIKGGGYAKEVRSNQGQAGIEGRPGETSQNVRSENLQQPAQAGSETSNTEGLNLKGLVDPVNPAEQASTPIPLNQPEPSVTTPTATPEVPQTTLRASAFGAGEFLKQDVAPVIGWVPKAVDAFKRVAMPATRGPIAKQAAETIRDYAGRAARENDIAFSSLKDARNAFSKQPDANNLSFMDRMETGQQQPTPEESRVAASMRTLLNQDRDQVRAVKPELLQNFYENYFPHIWKDPAKAQGVFAAFFGKRPFEGSKAFLRQRTLPTIADGIAAGLEPVSTNPVDLVLLKHAEIQRFLVAHRTLAEFKANGLAKFFKVGEKPPDGWTKVNDKISDVYFPGEQGLVKAGSYYMPDEAAQVLNNHLSPGLSGNAIFDGWRQSNMLMTQAMLGLSAFHGTVTSLNSVMSKISLASQYIAEGRGAEAAKAIAKAPTAPIADFFYGKKLQQEWANPGAHPELAPLVEMMQRGGIRSKMEQVYMTNISRSMRDAFNQGNLPGAAIRAPFALFEQTAKPIMQYLVPRLKMAAAADMMQAELLRLGPNATIEQQRSAAARAVDSVDNRFGMLTYDNLFMNKMVKDGMLSSLLSFGWNLGTFRELGGGALDIAKAPYRLVKGQQAFTPRIGYSAIALPMVTALMGSTLNYLMTGKPPQEIKDAFFPRTGRIDKHGNPIRMTLPTYAKDAYAFYKQPITTIQHKMSPLLNTTIELLQNRDYYGDPIILSDKPADEKLKELGAYLADKMTPISLRTQSKVKIPHGKALQFVGVSPAASYINQRKEPKPMRTIQVPYKKPRS